MSLDEYGHWVSDTVFEFDEPRQLGPGIVVRQVDTSTLFTEDAAVTKEMIIEALAHAGPDCPAASVAVAEIVCYECGVTGHMPAEAVEHADPMKIRCPDCIARALN